MAGSSSYPTTLANLAAGNEPLSILDGNFTPLYAAINSLNTFTNYYQDAGSASAYSVTVSAPQTFSLTAGVAIWFKAANTNTPNPTLNVNATAAKSLVDPSGVNLSAGAIRSNGIYLVVYDGTNYQVLSTLFSSSLSATSIINVFSYRNFT